MSDAMTPRRPGRPKGPGKKRPESDPAGGSAQSAVADASSAPSNGDHAEAGEGQNQGQGRPGRGPRGGPKPGRPNRGPEPDTDFVPTKESALQVPTKPVEVPPETQEDEAAAAAAKAQKPAFTVNIAKLQAMTMTELNGMARDLGIENFG